MVLEAARNVACTGARPLALVNCLNFGNPEHPEVMWQFSEVVEGMSEACEALGIPVIGGNVSASTTRRAATTSTPRPVVGRARADRRSRRARLPGAAARRRRRRSSCSARSAPELGGSEWAAVVHGLDGGVPPAADLDARVPAARARRRAGARAARSTGVHDVSDGGLAVALCEMAIARRDRLPGRPARASPGARSCTAGRGGVRRVDVAGGRDGRGRAACAAVLGAAAAAGRPGGRRSARPAAT